MIEADGIENGYLLPTARVPENRALAHASKDNRVTCLWLSVRALCYSGSSWLRRLSPVRARRSRRRGLPGPAEDNRSAERSLLFDTLRGTWIIRDSNCST